MWTCLSSRGFVIYGRVLVMCVSGDACVSSDAWVSGNVCVPGDACAVSGDVCVSGNPCVSGDVCAYHETTRRQARQHDIMDS